MAYGKPNKKNKYWILRFEYPNRIQICISVIKTSNYEKLLVAKIDRQLKVDEHDNYLYRKANNPFKALSMVAPYSAIYVRSLQKRINT